MALDAPKEIDMTFGPRQVDDTWWHHFNRFDGFQPIIEAPWAQGADPLITQQYAQWSIAAESFLASTSPEAAEDEAV